jgi:hypothetical protein
MQPDAEGLPRPEILTCRPLPGTSAPTLGRRRFRPKQTSATMTQPTGVGVRLMAQLEPVLTAHY